MFKASDFKDILTEDQANAVERRCIEILDIRAHVVYGSYLKDKNNRDVFKRFSSELEGHDSHVAYLLKPKYMHGLDDDEDLDVVLDDSNRNIVQAQKELLELKSRENNYLRKGKE